MRLWVEISLSLLRLQSVNVSLLVRLWVEIVPARLCWSHWKSASLWGCELKYVKNLTTRVMPGQPPCEAVSWNFLLKKGSWQTAQVSLLVRLWVEITLMKHKKTETGSASLWGCELKCFRNRYLTTSVLSASLWGCELKCKKKVVYRLIGRQPPCEAVSWNATQQMLETDARCQPPCEAVSWNTKYGKVSGNG